MGWSGGSGIFSDIYLLVRDYLKDRPDLIKKMIDIFEQEDCDTMYEVVDEFPEVGDVLKEMYPCDFE